MAQAQAAWVRVVSLARLSGCGWVSVVAGYSVNLRAKPGCEGNRLHSSVVENPDVGR